MEPLDYLSKKLLAHTEERFGYPRCDWKGFTDSLDAGVRDRPGYADAISDLWIEMLRGSDPPDSRTVVSENHIVVSWAEESTTHLIVESAEKHRMGILHYLRGIARDRSPGRLPLLLFGTYERFLDYVCDYDSDSGEFATMGAMFIPDVVAHVAMPAMTGDVDEITLAHELTHSHLDHLSLPLWLNEGFATVMEDTLLGLGTSLTTEMIQRHREFWDENNLQWFWAGAAFQDPEAQVPSYSLAQVLMRGLASDYDRLADFAQAASELDGGAEAYQEVYGRSLGTLPIALLGEGAWEPRPGEWPDMP